MSKVQLENDMCGQITLQGQLLTIRDKNYQTCLQIFVKLMHYLIEFTKLFITKCKFDLNIKPGYVIESEKFCLQI